MLEIVVSEPDNDVVLNNVMAPAEIDPHEDVVPSVVKYFPELPVCDGTTALDEIPIVTSPDDPPPVIGEVTLTAVMSPGAAVVHTKSMSVFEFFARIWPVVPPLRSANDVSTA